MNKASKASFFFGILISLFLSSSAQTCRTHTLSTSNQYPSCIDLPVLNSFLHWTYNQPTSTARIAFRRPGTSASTWIAWAINPQGQRMLGSQALVAFRNSSGAIQAYTSQVTNYDKVAPGNLSFGVPNISATYENEEMTIFATLELGSGTTSVNQVWQEGALNGDSPGAHAMTGNNMNSMGTLDLLSGQTTVGGGSNSRIRKKNVHGVLNAVSWGTLMPMGAMFARYMKVSKAADPAWFYLHIACQSSAYIVGVAGWATGLKLGSDSPGTQYDTHRNIGITLFVLGTLQVFALLLRPKKDHKYRFYWNIYHHSIGHTVIILSIINVYEGLDILNPDGKWKKIYSAILIVLGAIALILEAFTWFVVIKRKKVDKFSHGGHGTNGVNGYGARTHNGV